MRTLLLTSGGVKVPVIREEFLKILPKPLESIHMAHIITAAKVAKDTAYLVQEYAAFAEMGIGYEDIDLEGKTENELMRLLQDKDCIYVQGGDPYYLLKHAKLSGLTKVIATLVEQGKLYVGMSAGSYLACPTIESTLWKKPQRPRHGLPDDEPALSLIPFWVVVHYEDRHRETILGGNKEKSLPVRILTDEQALLVRDDRTTLVGKGAEIVI